MLKIDSHKIMIAQMPVISGPQYQGQALLYPARQEDADLLNQYFRENTGPVDASQLNLCDNVVDLSGYSITATVPTRLRTLWKMIRRLRHRNPNPPANRPPK